MKLKPYKWHSRELEALNKRFEFFGFLFLIGGIASGLWLSIQLAFALVAVGIGFDLYAWMKIQGKDKRLKREVAKKASRR